MDAPPALSPDVLASLPPAVVALIDWQAGQIRLLTARVAELEAKLGKNPTNSSKPPSATHPHDKATPSKAKSGRARGGQPGHDKHDRALIPTEQCQDVVPCVPSECRRCGRPLAGVDPEPLRQQVWELPEIRPLVTEYQRHRLVCACGCSTCGDLPPGVPAGQAGPRLIAFAGLLMACFRQSKRRAAQFLSLILNQPATAGWMVLLQGRASDAVLPAYHELAARLPAQPVLHVDESPTKEGQSKSWVWTFVAATFSFFACRTSRAADVPQELLGTDYAGVVHCDRARMYWAFGRLQWCWAHLKRDFQALIDSSCATAKRLGHDLRAPTKELFALWQKVRDGTMSRRAFRRRMRPVRQRVDALLLRGYYNARTRGFCKELVEHGEHLWTFVDVDGVEPTNNAAEQALRQAVIWRKLSFGTQSASGSRFVERLLTVIETCRRQSRNVFAWLVEAVQAHTNRQPVPSLLPTL
ncbi:MAG TPA: IS66 family transposase [Candidatus Sulfotelmatobacter sp.]|nr:IS66 family transposase [Candidatus Sulfotelmatobacter sp.]